MTERSPDLSTVQAAARRIRGRVRRTPVPAPMRGRVPDAGRLLPKPECLQVTGSFKARGAADKLLTLSAEERARGLVTASGGNHGAAVAAAAASPGRDLRTERKARPRPRSRSRMPGVRRSPSRAKSGTKPGKPHWRRGSGAVRPTSTPSQIRR